MDAISAERGRISRQLQRSASERDRLLFQAEIVSLHEQEQELFRQLTGSNECFASSAFEAASNTNVWLWEEGAIWMVALYQSGQFKMIQVPPSAQPGVKKAIAEVDLPQIERLLGTSIAFH